jgi:hypothetical protein
MCYGFSRKRAAGGEAPGRRSAPALGALGLCLSGGLLILGGCRSEPPAPPPGVVAPDSSPPLPASGPVELLEKCLARYDSQGIRGYWSVLEKQERTEGTLHPREVIKAAFRARPYSVFMRWLQGARRARSALYVEGANGGKMLVRPAGLAGLLVKVAPVDPNGPEAHQGGRYPITQFGLRETVQQTLRDWKAAREKGALKADYLGVAKVRPTGDRPCYVLRRTLPEPDPEGVVETTVYLDKESWFQVGTELRGRGGALFGEYWYRDIQLNPAFPPNQFEPSALTAN